MAASTVDYDALAKQFGGTDEPQQPVTSSAPKTSKPDYDKLAAQFGGSDTPLSPPQPKQENPFFGATTTPIKELSTQPQDTGQISFNPEGQGFRSHRNVQAYNPPPETAKKEQEFQNWMASQGLGQSPYQPEPAELGQAALMGATEALPAAARAAANPRVQRALQGASAAVNGYFAAMMAKGAGERVSQAADAYKRGDYSEMAARLGQGGTEALFAALGLKGLAETAVVKEPMGQYQARQAQKPPSERDIGAGGTRGPVQPEVMPKQSGVGAGGPTPTQEAAGLGLKTPSNPTVPPDTAQAQNIAPAGPPPPTNTKSPGPRTPVLPTAATPTAPESAETLNLQLQQMSQGVRKAVMIPKSNLDQGFVPADPLPAGVSMTADAFGNRYYYDRQQGITKAQVHAAVQGNKLPELLGGPVGMGAPDKSAIDPATAIVVKATAPTGAEVQSTATTPEMLEQTVAATEPVVPEGGSVQVVPPVQAIAERQLGPASEPPPASTPAIPPTVPETPPAPQPETAQGTAENLFARRRAREQAAAEQQAQPGGVEQFLRSEEGLFTPGQAIAHIKALTHPFTDAIRKVAAPQTRGDTAKAGAGTVRNMEGRRMRAEALAKGAFEGFRNHFQKMPPSFQVNSPGKHGVHGLDVIDAIEHGKTQISQLDPTSQQFATTLRNEMDHWKGELQKRGLLNSFKDDYFHRSWVQPAASKAREFFRGRAPLEGSKQYTKKQTYDLMSQAMQDPNFDLVPKFENPVDYVLDYVAQAAKHVTAHDVFTEWRNAGYLPFYRSPRDVPQGYAKINDPIFTVFGPKFGAVKLPGSAIDTNTGMPVNPNDVRVYGRREMGNYYAPEELARVANNFLSTGAQASGIAPLFNAWMQVKNATNALNLGFSAFHGVTTLLNSSMSDLALALRDVAAGKPGSAIKHAAEFATPGRSIVRDLIRGTHLEKIYDGKIKNDPMGEAVIQALEMAGGSPHQAVWAPDFWYKGMKKSWDEGAKKTAILKALNPLLWSEQFPLTKLIMEKMVPRVKLAAFERAMAQEVERHPMMGVDEARERFAAIWDSMDNVFGQLNQKNMLMSAPVRDLMNGIAGRPGWTVGNLRMIFGGTSDFIRGEGLTHRGAQLLASIIGAALINGVISAIVSAVNKEDKEPFSWMDFIAPRSGGYTEDGRPARMVLPLYLSKDYRSWATHPVRTAKAKLTPVLMMTGDLLENRDFFRHKIYGEGGIGLLRYLLQGFSPYSVTGSLQNIERGQKLGQVLLPQIGVMPASREASMSKAERLIYEWRGEHQPEMRSATTAHSRARQKVFLAAKEQGNAAASKLAEKYVQEGTLNAKEVRDALAKAGKNPLLNDVKGMNGEGAIRTVVKVYDAATPAERKQIEGEVRKKLYNARTKPWEWDEKTRTLAKRYFNVEPARSIGSPSPVGAGR